MTSRANILNTKSTHNDDSRLALGRVGAGGLYSNSFSPTRPGPGGGWRLGAGGA